MMAGNVGFIGLGAMGGPMASNLIAHGLSLLVHDIGVRPGPRRVSGRLDLAPGGGPPARGRARQAPGAVPPIGARALLFGLGFGARGPIITAIAAELFPGRRFGAIYGLLSVGNGLDGAIGPWFAGALFDVTGSYRAAFLLATVFCVAGSACSWLARPPAEERGR
jgi:MFS family permease